MFTGSIAALITPMQHNGSIDYDALERLLALHLAQGTQGLVLLGSTGEGSTVTHTEKLAIVRASINFLKGRIPVVVGVGSNSTAITIEYAQEVAALKPDGLLTICPYYNRPTQEGLSLPIIAYNHPGRTGVDLLPQTAARIAQLNSIVGLKEAVTKKERFIQLRELCPADFLLFSGDDETCLDFIASGGQGVISVAANIVPGLMQEMVGAALRQDFATAENIHQRLSPLFAALNLESNPIPLKWAMAHAGYSNDVLRLPLTPLSKEHHSTMVAALELITR